MAQRIKTTDINKFGDKETKHIKVKDCHFPFRYYKDLKTRKGEKIQYNYCIDGPKGKWCATEVSGSGGVKSMAYCIDGTKSSKSPKAKSPPKSAKKSKKAPRSLVIKSKTPDLEDDVDLKALGMDISNYLPRDIKQVIPSSWELPNRKVFPDWIDESFKKYHSTKGRKPSIGFDLFPHQKFVRDFMQPYSPYRGLLLYHGLGVGKTCASIAIAEGFKSNRKIIVILNKSLKQNFKINLKFCGDQYMRLNQHWIQHKIKTPSDPMINFGVKHLGIPKKVILSNKTLWMIDFTKESNFESLSKTDMSTLQEQINAMIDARYTFIHLNGLNENRLKRMRENGELDNKILVIDEVHNLTNGMAKNNPGLRARYLEYIIMNAKNLRLVFLSGTPMINNLFEIGKIFNLLRGYIISYSFFLKPFGAEQKSLSAIEKDLVKNKYIDQYMVKPRNNNIILTKVPDNFVNNDDRSGIIPNPVLSEFNNDPEFLQTLFIEKMKDYFKSVGYLCTYTVQKNTAVPNDEDEFMRMFFDQHSVQLKNLELFKSRIMGLVSHYASQDSSKMPKVNKSEIVEVDMSDYQFMKYMEVRKGEIEQESRKKTQGKPKAGKKKKAESPSVNASGDNLFEPKSSYRAYSRMHCSFTFPEEVPRPYPSEDATALQKLIEESQDYDDADQMPDLTLEEKEDALEPHLEEMDPDQALEFDKKENKLLIKLYEKAKNSTLKKLEKNMDKYLVANEPDKLGKYSPKYNTIMTNILKSPGNVFCYTEYRTMEGIAVFSLVLKANGFAPFLIKKDSMGNWEQYLESPEDVDKPKYAFWGEDEETSDVILKIFNNETEKLQPKLKEQVFGDKNNIRGDIIKIILTTKKGAEGISLYNVRQVHIIEPYWNPVRLEQVTGRAIRVDSHKLLPPKDRNVDVFTYLASIKPEHLKSDKLIQDDSGGLSSDQVLFEISNRKLSIMNELLNIVKGVSIDCGLNLKETLNPENPHSCLNYSARDRNTFAFIPNIREDTLDEDRRRLYATVKWIPKIIELTKGGKTYKFAVKVGQPGEKDLIYDYKKTKSGKPGNPIGEFKVVSGNKIPFFYKKKGGSRKRVRNTNRSHKK
jgi:hypothetical protein